MKIIIVAYGSRGDIQPFVALCVYLNKTGHTATLCGPPEFASWAKGCGCPYYPVKTEFTRAMELITDWARSFFEFHYLKDYTKILRQFTWDCFDMLPPVIEGADVIIGSHLIASVQTLAEASGIPYCFVALCPQSLPSSHHPSPYIPNFFSSKVFNAFTWQVFKISDNIMLRKTINGMRRELKLKPVRDLFKYRVGTMAIVATDKLLGIVPRDVAYRNIQTGYLQMEQNEKLSDEILSFINAGSKPMYIGLGSMPSADNMQMSQLLVDAARSLNQRMILFSGAAKLSNVYNDTRCLVIDGAPHMQLFPLMSLVIHHGGAGTTATASRSGVPQIIIPHIYDQFYWANQVRILNIGRHVGWNEELTVEKIARAMQECIADREIAAKAREVALQLKSHDSFATLRHYIETNFQKKAPVEAEKTRPIS